MAEGPVRPMPVALHEDTIAALDAHPGLLDRAGAEAERSLPHGCAAPLGGQRVRGTLVGRRPQEFTDRGSGDCGTIASHGHTR